MHKNNVHHHLKGTAFARCNNKRKLHQQILWAQASCFTCWSGIYSWQGKYQCVRLHRTAFSYLVNATQAVKQISHTVCLFCHPVPEYFHLKKNINTISCKYNYQPSFTSISYQKKVFYIITDASNCHLKPSLILLLTGCDSQNTVTTVSKYADPQPSGAVPFDLSVSNNVPIFVHILISLYLVPSTPYHQVSSGSVLASQLKLPDTHATCLLARIQIELQAVDLPNQDLKGTHITSLHDYYCSLLSILENLFLIHLSQTLLQVLLLVHYWLFPLPLALFPPPAQIHSAYTGFMAVHSLPPICLPKQEPENLCSTRSLHHSPIPMSQTVSRHPLKVWSLLREVPCKILQS